MAVSLEEALGGDSVLHSAHEGEWCLMRDYLMYASTLCLLVPLATCGRYFLDAAMLSA